MGKEIGDFAGGLAQGATGGFQQMFQQQMRQRQFEEQREFARTQQASQNAFTLNRDEAAGNRAIELMQARERLEAARVEARVRREAGKENRGILREQQLESRNVERRKLEIAARSEERGAERTADAKRNKAERKALQGRFDATLKQRDEARAQADVIRQRERLADKVERSNIRTEDKEERKATTQTQLDARIAFAKSKALSPSELKRAGITDPKSIKALIAWVDQSFAVLEANTDDPEMDISSVGRTPADLDAHVNFVNHDAKLTFDEHLELHPGDKAGAFAAMAQVVAEGTARLPTLGKAERKRLLGEKAEAAKEAAEQADIDREIAEMDERTDKILARKPVFPPRHGRPFSPSREEAAAKKRETRGPIPLFKF